MRNLKFCFDDHYAVATIDRGVVELHFLVSVELLSTVISGEYMRRDTLTRYIFLILGDDKNIQRINLLRVSSVEDGIYIRATVEVFLFVCFPQVIVAFTDRSVPCTSRSSYRYFLQTNAKRVDTVATGCCHIAVFVLTIRRDDLTTPCNRLTRTNSSRIMLVERNTFR